MSKPIITVTIHQQDKLDEQTIKRVQSWLTRISQEIEADAHTIAKGMKYNLMDHSNDWSRRMGR